jgi:hypothetical protein
MFYRRNYIKMINKFCRQVQDFAGKLNKFAGKKNLRVNLIKFAGKFKYTPIKSTFLSKIIYFK